MRPWTTTLTLAGVLAALVAVDVALVVAPTEQAASLPILSELDPARVREIRVVRPEDTIRVVREESGGRWTLERPIEAPADDDPLRTLVLHLRRGTPMEVRIDEGDLSAYGLGSGEALRLQIRQDGEDTPRIDVYVGDDTVGGASFVRFPNDDIVYRAPIGGRARLAKPARAWRDPTVLPIDPDTVTAITRTLPDGTSLPLTRTDAGWALADAPDVAVDSERAAALVERLTTLRAGRVLPGDVPVDGPPAVTLNVAREGSPSITIRAWRGEAAYVTRADRDGVFQVAASAVDGWVEPRAAWRDRQLIQVDRADIATMAFDRPDGRRFVLEQDASTSRWRAVQPANVDAPLRTSMQAAIRLAGLRADGIAEVRPEDAGLPSDVAFTLNLRSGREIRLEVGRQTTLPGDDTPLVFVRTTDQPDRIGVLRLSTYLDLARAFAS